MLDEQERARTEAPAQVFYRLDYSCVTRQERMVGQPAVALPFIWLMGLLQGTTHASTDEPPVTAMQPFEVAAEAVPPEVRALFAPFAQELGALGFREPVYHMIIDSMHSARIYWVTYRHESGQALARIHYRVWSLLSPPRIYFFPLFISELDGGTFLTSSAGRLDLLAPADWQADYYPGEPLSTVWAAHQNALNTTMRLPRTVHDQKQMRGVIERHHGGLRDFHLARGVFKPVSIIEQQQLDAGPIADIAVNSEDQAVLAQLYRRQEAKPGSKWRPLIILIASLLLFVLAGFTQEKGYMRFLLLAIPILGIHELGHYLAMKLFGYRNLRMFFIPLLGAAVTGQNYNVPGWKKAIISLAGPLPGILLALPLGIISVAIKNPLFNETAIMFIVINAFNLLPIMPLDGGQLAHTLFFSRNPYLDIAFRVLAIIGIVVGSALLHLQFLYIIAIPMALGLPLNWRMARIVRKLRPRQDLARSPDSQHIPVETAKVILDELRAIQTKATAPVLAQQITGIFELLNARPPGVWATLGLGFAHVFSLVLAVIIGIVIAVLGQPDFLRNLGLGGKVSMHQYARGATQEWHGNAPSPSRETRATIYATGKDAASAKQAFAKLQADLPDQSAMRLFGQSLIITLPDADTAGQGRLLSALRPVDRDAFVVRKDEYGIAPVHITCIAPGDAAAAKRLQQALTSCFPLGARPDDIRLIPPWSPRWQALPPGEQQRCLIARRTHTRISVDRPSASQDPEIRALFTRLEQAEEAGNKEEMEKIQDSLSTFHERNAVQFAARLRAEGAPQVDIELIDRYERWRKFSQSFKYQNYPSADTAAFKKDHAEFTQQRSKLERAVYDLMGLIPFSGGKLSPADAQYSVDYGDVDFTTQQMSFRFVSFTDPAVGLPALAEWLYDQGCTDVRYGIAKPGSEYWDEPAHE
ncbi:MAG: site-2 protease family protein [Armatimonadota bacterium]